MKSVIRKTFVLLLVAAAGLYAAKAQNLTVKITKTDNSEVTKTAQASLEAALSGVELNTVASLEITGGDFVAADWLWLRDNNSSLDQLAGFTITNAVNSVADIPNSDYTQPRYFSSSLKNVSVAKLNRIGSSAFECGGLTDVSFPDVTEVGSWVFRECQQLVNVSLPKATTLGEYAFYQCGALTTISLPSVVNTGWWVFQNCTALTSVDMPALTTLGHETFSNCSALTNLNLPELTTIEDEAFSGCTALASVDFPKLKNVKSLDGCTALQSANLPLAEKIENEAFSGCIALSSITVPKLTFIDENAFKGCTRLVNMRLGATPPTAYSTSFTGCPTPRFLQLVDEGGVPLTDPELTNARTAYKAKDDGDTTDDLWFGWEVDKELYVISVESITNGSLMSNYKLCAAGTKVIITANPEAGYSLKANSLKVYKTDAPDTTVPLDGHSFTMPAYAVTVTAEFETNNLQLMLNGDTSKSGVSLEDALQDVGLSTITSLEITSGSFNTTDWLWLQEKKSNLNNISSFTITSGVSHVADIPGGTQSYFNNSLKSVSVAGLVNIGNRAFYGSALTSATFPDIKTIGNEAFRNSQSLATLHIPVVETIGTNAFRSCIALKGIDLQHLKIIGNSGFSSCSGLETVNLPNVEEVGAEAFSACTSLT